jgi:hypothetical protein
MELQPAQRRLRLQARAMLSRNTAAGGDAARVGVSTLLAADIERERERIAHNASWAKGMTASDYHAVGLPFPVLPLGPDGNIMAGALAEMRGAWAAAAARHAYREASLMHELLAALGPTSHPRAPHELLSDRLALRGADERAAFFPGVVAGVCKGLLLQA